MSNFREVEGIGIINVETISRISYPTQHNQKWAIAITYVDGNYDILYRNRKEDCEYEVRKLTEVMV